MATSSVELRSRVFRTPRRLRPQKNLRCTVYSRVILLRSRTSPPSYRSEDKHTSLSKSILTRSLCSGTETVFRSATQSGFSLVLLTVLCNFWLQTCCCLAQCVLANILANVAKQQQQRRHPSWLPNIKPECGRLDHIPESKSNLKPSLPRPVPTSVKLRRTPGFHTSCWGKKRCQL